MLDRPDSPRLKTDYNKTKTSITISWTPPFNGNSPILAFLINHKTSSNPSRPEVVPISGQKTSYKITELEPYTRYEVSVQAKNALGMSGSSNVIDVETAEDGKVTFH